MAYPNTAMKWLYQVERLALRAVAPRRAARSLRPPGAGRDSDRPLCAGGVVAARPLPPPNGHAIAVSGCALLIRISWKNLSLFRSRPCSELRVTARQCRRWNGDTRQIPQLALRAPRFDHARLDRLPLLPRRGGVAPSQAHRWPRRAHGRLAHERGWSASGACWRVP